MKSAFSPNGKSGLTVQGSAVCPGSQPMPERSRFGLHAAKMGLKKLRASQPFNFVATSSLRGLLGALGVHSELVIKHAHRMGPVRANLPNGRTLRLWSRADDWVSNQIYWRGWNGYEPETTPLFFRLAGKSRVTIDVGAYVGFFTLLAAHANQNGRVYAFEPMPDVYMRLLGNVELNQLSNVECINSAVGDTHGSAEFYHTAIDIPCSSSLSYEFMRTARDLRSSTVAVTNIDRFVQKKGLDYVDLVKIDTESTEPQVLQGMADTIRRHRPHIICEVLKGRGSEQLVEDIVRDFGYYSYHLTPDGPIHREHIEGHSTWLNYLFTTLRPDEAARI